MKKLQLFIAIILTSFCVISCEDVVNVDLDTAAPKLVIDASIKWQKGTDGKTQKIKLTTTTDYYSNIIPVATGATVSVKNITAATPTTFQFIEDGQTGEYVCNNFTPIINNDYELTIVYKGETYSGTSKFMPTPVIEKTEQILKPGFGGEDMYEIKFYFQDNGAEDNFYLVGAKNSKKAYPEYGVLSDEFFQGNMMFAIYMNEDLKKGDVVQYSLQGITEKYNNYMNKLITSSGVEGNGPFAIPQASAIRGNIVNKTNPDNFPFGYFHLSEIDSGTHTIE